MGSAVGQGARGLIMYHLGVPQTVSSKECTGTYLAFEFIILPRAEETI